jgi:hypothetical protein
VRAITEYDLEKMGPKASRLQNLVGKVGVFCDAVALKSKKAIDAFVNNTVRTVSPGIDVAQNVIRELSIVPIPAIQGLSLFSMENNQSTAYSQPLTMQDAINGNKDMEELKEKFEDLSDTFWDVVCNIINAPEEVTQTTDPSMLINQAIFEYSNYIASMLNLGDDSEANPAQAPAMLSPGVPKGGKYPNYLLNQQGVNPTYNPMTQNNPRFSMYGVESSLAEFGKFGSFVQATKDLGSDLYKRGRASAGRAKDAFTGAYKTPRFKKIGNTAGKGGQLGLDLGGAGGTTARNRFTTAAMNTGKAVKDTFKSGKAGATAVVGTGLAGAAGAGYLAAKMANRRRKNKGM